MIVDANTLAEGSTISADICIVGAGVAGIALGHEFRDSNSTLAIIESGGLEPNVRTQALNVGKNVGIPYYELDQTRTRAFGGTSHHWCCELGGSRLGARLMGFGEIDFERRDWVPNSGWPFKKSELDPFYERAHRFCEIGPYSYSVEGWKDRLPPEDVPLMPDSEVAETRIFQFAQKTLWYGKYREVLDRSANVTVYLNATVLGVRVNPGGSAVTHLDATTLEGKRIRFEARNYVLAGGGIETPRLMLLSSDVQPQGLGNDHDNVGRYFMEHPHLWTGYVIPTDPRLLERIQLYKVHSVSGVPIMAKFSLRESVQRREKLLNFTTSIHPVNRQSSPEAVQVLKQCLSQIKAGKFSSVERRVLIDSMVHFPTFLGYGVHRVRNMLDRDYRHGLQQPNLLVLNSMSEQVPHRESRVLLGEEKDRFGQNRVELKWHLTSQDINSIRRSQQLLGNELRRYGIGELVVELSDDSIPPKIHGGWHHMGTTRMDDDPKKGVVDRHCQVHGVSNLFIAGASVFPIGGYANPVLTMLALTLRLGQHLKMRRPT